MRTNLRKFVFVFILLAAALPVAARHAPPPPPAIQLTPFETYVIGEMIVVTDTKSYQVFGAANIAQFADDMQMNQNASALRSLVNGQPVPVHFVVTQITNIIIPGSSVTDLLTAAQNNKSIAQLYTATGSDVVFLWSDDFWSGEAAVPGQPSDFSPTGKHWFAYAYTGISVDVKVHEGWHLFGAQHNPEASVPPGTSIWKTALDKLEQDGTCGIMGYCASPVFILTGPGSVYEGTAYGDVNHNNAAMAALSAPWVAAYNLVRPMSIERTCVQDGESACLENKLLVRVQWADPNSPDTEFAPLSYSTGSSAGFAIGGAAVQVTAIPGPSPRHQPAPINLRLVAGAAPSPYRIIVTDTTTGHVRAWQASAGQAWHERVAGAF
jgi:hypothetical protein